MATEEDHWVIRPGSNDMGIWIGTSAARSLSPELRSELQKLAKDLHGQDTITPHFHCPRVNVDNCEIHIECFGMTTP